MGYRYTDDQFIEALRESKSIEEVLPKLGLTNNSGTNTNTMYRNILRLRSEGVAVPTGHIENLDEIVAHFNPKSNKISLDLWLRHNSLYRGPLEYLAMRIVKEGKRHGYCQSCSGSSWMDKPIPITLRVANRVEYDYRIENLLIVCLNCASFIPQPVKELKIKNFRLVGKYPKVHRLK